MIVRVCVCVSISSIVSWKKNDTTAFRYGQWQTVLNTRGKHDPKRGSVESCNLSIFSEDAHYFDWSADF